MCMVSSAIWTHWSSVYWTKMVRVPEFILFFGTTDDMHQYFQYSTKCVQEKNSTYVSMYQTICSRTILRTKFRAWSPKLQNDRVQFSVPFLLVHIISCTEKNINSWYEIRYVPVKIVHPDLRLLVYQNCLTYCILVHTLVHNGTQNCTWVFVKGSSILPLGSDWLRKWSYKLHTKGKDV